MVNKTSAYLAPTDRVLDPKDLDRIKKILGLGDDYRSRWTIEKLTEIYYGNRLSKRQSTVATRHRLRRLEQAAAIKVDVLQETDERGLDAWLFRLTGAPIDVAAERAKAAEFLERVRSALIKAPSPGHRQRGNNQELIRILASLYEIHAKKRPSPRHQPFAELVRIILGLEDPTKDIRKALGK